MRALLNWIAATASFLGLFFTLHNPSTPLSVGKTVFLVIVVLVFAAAALIDIKEKLSRRAKSYSEPRLINDYMFEMLRKAGNCIIYTRDASWTNEQRIRSLLAKKAGSGELTICMPVRTKLCDELEVLGATIVNYPNLGISPTVRFTIANAGRTSESFVAIGSRVGNKHVIEELDSKHPAYSMAHDLIEVIRRRSVS